MALGARLEWAQFSDFDFFEVYRSDTPMDINNLPSPIATNLKKMTYFDGNVTKDNYYYYRVAVVKGAERVISSEIIFLASIDPYSSNVSLLLLLDSNLLDQISKTNLVNNGSVPFVNSPTGKALAFYGDASRYISDNRSMTAKENLSGGAFTIEFFARLTPNSVSGNDVLLSFGYASYYGSRQLSWWISLNSSLSFIQSNDGNGGNTQRVGGTIPTSINKSNFIHYAISKDDTGKTMVFADGIKIAESVINKAFYVSPYGLRIGKLDYNPYEYPFIGEVGQVRITKGVARYTDNFTPPSNFNIN